jgi:pimeloyl-ACP methyl ester carboxylesterase
VLLHGIGETWQVWEPCMDRLSLERSVIAVDLPGFGRSPAVRDEPTPQRLAIAVRSLLDDLGLASVHLAGISLGGWVALELALLGRARSVVGFSPAGLWPNGLPAYSKGILKGLHGSAVRVAGAADRFFAAPGARMVAFPNYARPQRIPAPVLVSQARALARAPGWHATLTAMESRRFRGGRDIGVPVTVAWGSRDVLLPKRLCQRREEMPSHTLWVTLGGCGHTPTWDAPETVAELTLRASRAGQTPQRC